MRLHHATIPLLLIAAPVAAQPAAPPPQDPPQLLDPQMPARPAHTTQALPQALLNLPVGEVRAAVDGREPTPADRALTVRDLGRRDDPNFDANFRRRIAQARPAMERGMKALNTALPAMEKALGDARDAIDRAVANMPDPTYPRR